MTRREEIKQKALSKYLRGTNRYNKFIEGAEWADKTIVDKLRELKSVYEKDLDAEPRIYERDIQLCAKISLIERLILELKKE